MFIKQILTQHRNDFTAKLQCEHCGTVEKLNTGYHDDNYHFNVIPAMHCSSCGKNRAGEFKQLENTDEPNLKSN